MQKETNVIETQLHYQNREISPLLIGILLIILNSLAIYKAYYSEGFGPVLVGLGYFTSRLLSVLYVYDIANNLKLDKRFWVTITIIFPTIGLCVTPFLGKGNSELINTVKFDPYRPTYTDPTKLTNAFFILYLILMLTGLIFT